MRTCGRREMTKGMEEAAIGSCVVCAEEKGGDETRGRKTGRGGWELGQWAQS